MANLKRLSILLLGLAFAGTGSMAWASPFGSGEAGVLLDNTFTDLDLGLLTQFFGYDTTSILNYGATITSTGFAAHLSGTYAGQSLNVTYTSIDLATFPGSPVTWTSTGSYGALSWSGSGSAQFAFPTSSTFTETYSSSLSLGAGVDTGSYSLSLGGNVGGFVEYTDGNGVMLVQGEAKPSPFVPTSRQYNPPRNGVTGVDDACYGRLIFGICFGREVIISESKVGPVEPDIFVNGTTQVVPEPSTLALMSAGLFSAAGFRKQLWTKLRGRRAER